MKNKITLITPPDYFENFNYSLGLINISQEDQEKITNWLEKLDIDEPLNIYFYASENNPNWLLYASKHSDLLFFDLDSNCPVAQILQGYILANPRVYYQTRNEFKGTVGDCVSSNRVPDIDYWLKEIVLPKLKPLE